MLFYEVRHFSSKLSKTKKTSKLVCGYFYCSGNNICQKKIRLFKPKIGGKNGKNPFQAILRLEKKRKWHGPLIY